MHACMFFCFFFEDATFNNCFSIMHVKDKFFLFSHKSMKPNSGTGLGVLNNSEKLGDLLFSCIGRVVI